jgi:hypothetical protein
MAEPIVKLRRRTTLSSARRLLRVAVEGVGEQTKDRMLVNPWANLSSD